MRFHGKIQVGVLAGLQQLSELRLREGTIGDKVHPEHFGVLPMTDLKTNVGSVLDDLVDFGCLAHIQYLSCSVHGAFVRIVPNTDPHKTSNNRLLEDWQVTESVQLVS